MDSQKINSSDNATDKTLNNFIDIVKNIKEYAKNSQENHKTKKNQSKNGKNCGF